MVFIRALLALHLLRHIQSVKVVIDGTIDFGPNWNFEYNKPFRGFQSNKIIPDNRNVLRKNDDIYTNAPSEAENGASIEIQEDTNINNERLASETDDNADDKINDETVYKVTRLFKDHKNGAGQMLKKPHKIKYDTQVIDFIEHIKNKSLKMFGSLRNKYQDKAIVQKIDELKNRYANKFGKFENETKHHVIRTKFGHEKVILNTIDYSNKLMDRLVNRFRIDTRNSGNESDLEASKTFSEHKNSLTNLAYEDACVMIGVCREGDEFTDHVSEIISNLLVQGDSQIEIAVEGILKALKAADFRSIMDPETLIAFNNALSNLEELNTFDLKVAVMCMKLLIESRHKPFHEEYPETPWLTALVAFYEVLEELNKKVIIDAKDWSEFKMEFHHSLHGGEVNVYDVAKKLINRFQTSIFALDDETVEGIKAKLRLCILNKALRMNLTSYEHFQPFMF